MDVREDGKVLQLLLRCCDQIKPIQVGDVCSVDGAGRYVPDIIHFKSGQMCHSSVLGCASAVVHDKQTRFKWEKLQIIEFYSRTIFGFLRSGYGAVSPLYLSI